MLGFTACKVCILGLSILGFDICLIPGYMNLPKSLFRTFRIAPTVKGTWINSSAFDEEPEYEYYFELGATQYCDESGCTKDVHKEGGEYVMMGRLFFKIQDSYYQDNSGVYNVPR